MKLCDYKYISKGITSLPNLKSNTTNPVLLQVTTLCVTENALKFPSLSVSLPEFWNIASGWLTLTARTSFHHTSQQSVKFWKGWLSSSYISCFHVCVPRLVMNNKWKSMLNSKLSWSCLHLEGNGIFVVFSMPFKRGFLRTLIDNCTMFSNAVCYPSHTEINQTQVHKQIPVLETVIRKPIAIWNKP